MKFMIAGLGSIGRRHLRNLETLGEDDILLYRTHQSTLPEEELKRYPMETDLGRALSYQPDAVIIANPTAKHMEIAIPAAKVGCALFVEKPIAAHLDDALLLEEVLNKNRNIFFSAYQFRFNPGLRKVKELLDECTVGRPLSFTAYWGEYLPHWHPWEDYRKSYAAKKELGGGVVLTLCHPLDYLRWMFGDVRELFAITGHVSDLELDVEDFADAVIEFKCGVYGMLHLDYFRRDKRQDLEIVCEKGTIYWEYATSAVKLFLPDGTHLEFPAPPGFDRNQMFLDEMTHFINVLYRKETPLCTFQDGWKALEFAWGILHSAGYKQRVVFG